MMFRQATALQSKTKILKKYQFSILYNLETKYRRHKIKKQIYSFLL